MIVEVCRRLVAYGTLRDITYVGLGAKEFVDFELVYETLGVQKMYSIESAIPLVRLKYNRPYEQIHIEMGTTNSQLPAVAELSSARCIVWLDYTNTFDSGAVVDLAYLGGVLSPGSAIFVTFNSHYDSSKWTDEQLQLAFGDYYDPALKTKDYVGHGLGDLQRDAAEAVLTKAVRLRADGANLDRALDVRYKDSSRMQVVGWIVSPQGTVASDDCRLHELDFTPAARSSTPLLLTVPDLTRLEWAALVKQLPVVNAAALVKPHSEITLDALEQFLAAHPYLQIARTGA